jgi:hypothetical protein
MIKGKEWCGWHVFIASNRNQEEDWITHTRG